MTLLELFLGFLKVGCFSFGGAYASIPIIREIVLSYGWLTDEALEHMIAVSESTPGPIMVNLATYVGASHAGLAGAAAATFAVVLPAFLIIVLLIAVFKTAKDVPWIKAMLSSLKSCVSGVILAVGAYMLFCAVFPKEGGRGFDLAGFDLYAALIAAVLIIISIIWKKARKKRFSPILTIVIAAGLGMLFYGV